MVHRKTYRNSPLKKHRFNFTMSLAILMIVIGITIGVLAKILISPTPTVAPEIITEKETTDHAQEDENTPKNINFQPIIDEWVESVNGNKSVIIYDLDREEIAGAYNTTEEYGTASLYKLFVVYEGYRRLENGTWQATAKAGSTGYTILECLDLAIRESHSPCAETLWSTIGHTNLDNIIKTDFNIQNSDISHLVSNPEDILKIMQIFYQHQDIKTPELISRMKNSFLIQPITTYDWRQGLPSGFSENVNVYNKVGWQYNRTGGYWDIYHDAAIIEFPDKNRSFITIVMTNRVPSEKISELGIKIEQHFSMY